MTLKHAAAAIGALLLLAAAGIGWWLVTVDPDVYRDELTAAVEGATGRRLALDGPIGLEPSLHPAFVLAGARLANAADGSEPEMLRADTVAVRVALLALLKGELVVEGITARGVDLLLERGPRGPNWLLTPASSAATASTSRAARVTVRRVRLEDVRVRYRTGRGAILTLELASLQAHAVDGDRTLDLQAEGRVQTVPFSLRGETGSVREWLLASRRLRYALTGKLAAGDAVLRGEIRPPAGPHTLSAELRIPDLGALEPLFDVPLPAAPLEAALRATSVPGGYRVEISRAASGPSSLSGEVEVRPDLPRPSFSGQIRAERLDLRELLQPDPEETAGGGGRVIPDRALPWALLEGIDAALEVRIDQLLAPDLIVGPLTAQVSLSRGILRIAPAEVGIGGSTVRLTIDADGGQSPPAVTVTLEAPALDTAAALAALGQEPWLATSARVSIALAGRGAGLRELAGTASGHARFLADAGTVRGTSGARLAAVDSAVGGLTRIVGGFMRRDAASSSLNCVAADFTVDAGVATSRVLLADTQHATITGSGRIDLGRERLDLLLVPDPKSVTLNVAVPIRVGGSLSAPTYRADELGVARRIGGVAAAFLFPPAALIGLVSLGAQDNPCLGLAQGGRASSQTARPERGVGAAAKDAVRSVTGKTKEVVKGIGGAVRGLFGRD